MGGGWGLSAALMHCVHATRNPKPETRNPKPATRTQARVAELERDSAEQAQSHALSVGRLEAANLEVSRTLEEARTRAQADLAARDAELTRLAATDAAIIGALEKTVDQVRAEHAPCAQAVSSRDAALRYVQRSRILTARETRIKAKEIYE